MSIRLREASRIVLKAAKETPGEMLAPWIGFYRAAREVATKTSTPETAVQVVHRVNKVVHKGDKSTHKSG